MGCHRNHAISHSPNQNLFEDTVISHPGGPNEQFGTHEKLSWGGVQGNLNWMPGYLVVAKYVEIRFQVNHNDEFRPNIKVGVLMVTREQPENSQLNLAKFIS